MFWGEYSHQLDEKGRLIIPVRYRPHLLPHCILTRGLDHNLVIYPRDAWQELSEHLNQIPITDAPARALRRLLFSGAVEMTIDRQGRMLIPAYLREYASLQDEVLIAGMENFIELWEPGQWRATLSGVHQSLTEAGQLPKLSI